MKFKPNIRETLIFHFMNLQNESDFNLQSYQVFFQLLRPLHSFLIILILLITRWAIFHPGGQRVKLNILKQIVSWGFTFSRLHPIAFCDCVCLWRIFVSVVQWREREHHSHWKNRLELCLVWRDSRECSDWGSWKYPNWIQVLCHILRIRIIWIGRWERC